MQQQMPQEKVQEQTTVETSIKDTKQSYFKDKLKKDFKEPLIIIILILIFTNNSVIQLISKYIPGMMHNNDMTTVGSIIRAIIVGLVFYIIKKFIK